MTCIRILIILIYVCMKSNLLTLEPCEIYVFGWDMFIVSIDAGAQVAIFTHFVHMWTLFGRWDRICTLGRAPRIKETLPDFHKRCQVTRHPRVFPRVDRLGTDPRFWGVIEFLKKRLTKLCTQR